MLVFDLDGTLVDSFGDSHDAVTGALRAIGLDTSDQVLALCRRGIGLELFYEHATGGRAADGAEFERFVDVYRAGYRTRGAPFPGVRATLAELRRRHPSVPFAVATTKRTDVARRVVETGGLADYFDLVRGSDGLPHKPDPAVLHHIAATTGHPIASAHMIGDTDRDVLAAQAAGCTAVAVTYGGWGRDELAALAPDHLIDRFDQLLDLPRLTGS